MIDKYRISAYCALEKGTLSFGKRRFPFLFFWLFIISLITDFSLVQAQTSDFEVGLINVGAGSVIGGIGAVINKEDDEKVVPVLLRGMAQGALGGYAVFESKRLVRTFARTENYNYVWPSKIVNSAGTSIIENAAANRKLWDQWHLDVGFTRLDILTENGFKIKYRIKPFSLYSALQLWRGNKVDWNKSLKLGALVFELREIEMNGENFRGATVSDHIALLDNNRSPLETEAHELIHIYQLHQFSGVNAYFNPVYNILEKEFNPFSIYKNIFYIDWNSPLYKLLITIDRNNSAREKDIFFEREAYYLIE